MMNYTIEKTEGSATWIYVTEQNEKKEKMAIELLECTSDGSKNSLAYLWYKAGYTNKIMKKYLSINTYCTDSEGSCTGIYNPQTKWDNEKNRNVINFDWLLENTEENKQKLIDEVIRLFGSAKGKSATEIKMEKIAVFAMENGYEIAYEKPEGYRECFGICCPSGSVVISDRKSFKQKDYKYMLLVY